MKYNVYHFEDYGGPESGPMVHETLEGAFDTLQEAQHFTATYFQIRYEEAVPNDDEDWRN